MTTSPRPAPSRASRRALLAGAALVSAGWVLSGCDDPAPPGGTPSPAPGDADGLLLERARAGVATAESFVAAVIAAHPALARRLTPLRELHAAHLAVLEGTAGTGSPVPVPTTLPVPRRGRRALPAVRTAEQEYAAILATGVQDATSGDLARVLASARAGVLMHLAALEATT